MNGGRRDNRAAGVTSALAMHGECFAHIFKGSRAAVDAVFDRVRRDPRHCDVVVLSRNEVEECAFPGEAITLVGHSERARRALDRVASRSGGSLANADPQALLAALRDIVSQKRSGRPTGTSGELALGQPRPADGWPTVPLDTGRLRTELAAAHPVAASGRSFRDAAHEAFEDLLAVAVFSAEGVVLRANSNDCAMLGRTANAIVGLRYEALIAPGDADRLRRL